MSPGDYRVGAVLLAAGASQRFGDRNKLLTDFSGRPMVRHVARAVLESRAAPIIAVTGDDHAAVEKALAGLALQIVRNGNYEHGMSSTLRVGIRALLEHRTTPVDGAVICLADMPWVRAEHVDALIGAFDPAHGRPICVPVYDRRRGNPVLWASSYFDEIGEITGDVGARGLLARHPASVHEVPVDDAGVVRDVDSPHQIEPH
ncbi:MAG TPA: nucleotidyltransferase family protein [Acidobacteriota bacterium]|nr:nucleotidyltransferase family protein [Acidobacteriota bacterium]